MRVEKDRERQGGRENKRERKGGREREREREIERQREIGLLQRPLSILDL